MANELYEATIQGSVELLLNLIEEDPLILDRIIVTAHEETPLHVAALLGHDIFCIQLLNLKPELARETDTRGSSVLHLAAARGHLGIVKTLVSLDPNLCFARDKAGRNPVHVAAMKGRISVLKELLEAKPEAALQLVNQDGGILHLSVDCSQFESLKLLLENVDFQESINCKDRNGNTVLHLAVADKQLQTVDYLLNHTMIEINAVNAYGLTAMAILFQTGRDKNDIIIAQRLQTSGAKKAENTNLEATQNRAFPNTYASGIDGRKWDQNVEKHDDWIERQRDALMVVASLIASMGFTAGVTPPAGVLSIKHEPTPWSYYSRFLVYNTISFISSITIILLLVSGVPFRRRVFMWILMVIVWIAVSSTACTYAVSVAHHLEYTDIPVLHDLLLFGFLSWAVVMLIGVGFHMNRIYWIVVRKFRKPARAYEDTTGIEAV